MADNGSILPFILIWMVVSLFWLFAMVPFSAVVLFPEQKPDPNANDLSTLRARLLELNDTDEPFRLVPEASESDLHLEWDVVDSSWYELYAKVKLTVTYRARLYLHEARRELRYHEVIKSSNFWLGFDGLTPRFNFSFFYSAGIGDVIWDGLAYGIKSGWPPRIGEIYRFHLDTIWAKRQVERVARESGWAFRPVIWWFEASAKGADLGRALSPPFMRDWSRLKFWGFLYVLSVALLLAVPITYFPNIDRTQVLTGVMVVGLITLGHAGILAIAIAIRKAHERHVSAIEEGEAEDEAEGEE